MATRRLEVVIAGDAKGAKKAFDTVDKDSKGLTSKLKGTLGKIGPIVAGGAIAGVAGVAVVLKGAFDAADESMRISKLTANVVKTTGGAAKISTKQVGDLAGKLSMLTGVDDELIQSGENVLLTFTDIRNEVGKGNDIFNQATGIALDMSKALGTDMKTSSIQVGKALNDPIKGVGALSKVGVSFTKQQKDQIKMLTASGDKLGAQKIILKELGKEFGGSAKAMGTPMDKLKVQLGNVQEEIGMKLIPVVSKIADWFAKMLPGAIDFAGRAFGKLKKFLEPVGRFIGNAVKQIKNLVDMFKAGEGDVDGFSEIMDSMFGNTGKLIPIFRDLYETGAKVFAFIKDVAVPAVSKLVEGFVGFVKANPKVLFAGLAAVVALLVGPFIAIAAGLVIAYTRFKAFRTVVDAVVSWLTGTAWPAIQVVAKGIGAAFGAVVGWVRQHWDAIKQIVGIAIAFVRNIIAAGIAIIQKLWETFGGTLIALVQNAWNLIAGVVQGAINVVAGIVRFVMALIHGEWGAAWDAILQVVGGFWTMIKAYVTTGINSVLAVVQLVGTFIQGAWSAIWTVIVAGVAGFWTLISGAVLTGINAVVGIVKLIGSSISTAWGAIWSGITGIVEGVWDSVAGTITRGAQAIVDVINTMIDGINAVTSKIPLLGGSLHIGRLPDVHKPSVSAPGIHKFDPHNMHTGGTFHAPRAGGEGLALLRDGEHVSPPGRGGGSGVTVHVHGSVLSERELVAVINKAQRRRTLAI